VAGDEEDCIMRNFITCTLYQIFLGRSVGHVARMGEKINAYKSWSEYLKGKNHSGNLGIDERIILKLILRKRCGKV